MNSLWHFRCHKYEDSGLGCVEDAPEVSSALPYYARREQEAVGEEERECAEQENQEFPD